MPARTLAIGAALEAGEYLLGKLGQVRDIRFKGEVDLVTEADEAAERMILSRLRAQYPEHGVLAEEIGTVRPEQGTSRYRWIVDPLDGTTNFAHGHPTFAISIALEVERQVELGVVYVPALDELFVAERGKGATLNDQPITVSATERLIRSLVATGFLYDVAQRERNLVHWGNFVRATQGVRRDGAAAIDLCYVACGRYDGFWEEGLAPWDTAAGSLMVREAGGMITDYAGAPFSIERPSCVASNGRIHAQMLAVLKQGLGAAADLPADS